MPRSLINLIGILVTIAVLAMGVFLIAGPVAAQALGVVGDTATAANANVVYQAQVDHLQEEEARLDEIESSVMSLQAQITPTNDLDDVFEVVARAAQSSGVTIVSVTAEDAVPFEERTAPVEAAPTAEQPADTAESQAPAGESGVSSDAAPAGRAQVPIAINISAAEMKEVVAFLDALRSGPRLLGQIETSVSTTGTGFNASLSSLAYVLPEEG